MQRFTDADLQRVRDQFYTQGKSVAEWARQHGFRQASVYQVLSGRSQARRGEAHRIAAALGLKSLPTEPSPDSAPRGTQ